MHVDRPGDESEPFFACFSDTGIKCVGRIEFAMELPDDRLRLIQMADVVLCRKLGSSSREPLKHERLDPFHIGSLTIHVDIVKHVAQIVSIGQIQHQVLGEFDREIFNPLWVITEQCNVE